MAPNSTAKPALPAKKKQQSSAAGGAKAGAKKAAASGKELPIAFSQMITLEDGTQVPVRIPPGMPADQAAAIVEYLRSNPEAAKAAWGQAQAILQSPGMANAFLNMQTQQADPAKSAEVYEALKDDPELQPVFDDVKANGPGALQKYWDDTELMSKISAKLREMRVGGGGGGPAGAANNAAGRPAGKGGKPPSEDVSSLHDAAKWDDLDAARRLLDGGADVNQANDRGITALGVAVGFNRRKCVELLLDAGADLEARDGAGNTVLHYAAGYGRMELCELLLSRGADIDAANGKKQKAVDVARLNGEKHVVAFLEKQAGKEQPQEA